MDRTVDVLHAKRVSHHLGGFVGGAVVHHDDLIQAVVQSQQGADGGLDGHRLVVGGDQDGHRHIVVVGQFVLQCVAPLGAIESGGAYGDGQEEETGVAHHIQDEKCAHNIEKILKQISYAHAASFSSLSAISSASSAAWAVRTACSRRRLSSRYMTISRAYRSRPPTSSMRSL